MTPTQEAAIIAIAVLGWIGFLIALAIDDEHRQTIAELHEEIADLRKPTQAFDQMAEQAVAMARALNKAPDNVRQFPRRSPSTQLRGGFDR